MSELNGTKTKKRFSAAQVMGGLDYPLVSCNSEAMWKYINDFVENNEKYPSVSDYIRTLIMNDLNIDEYARPRKKK